MIRSITLFCVLCALATASAVAQKSHRAHEEDELEIAHDVVFSMGTSIVPRALDEGSSSTTLVYAPSIGFGYTAMLSKHFGLATKNDIEFLNIEVKGRRFGEDAGDRLERENVLVLTGGALWSPLPRFAFYGGAGAEIDDNETLLTITASAEYLIFSKEEERGEWGALFEVAYHWKETYSSVNLGIAISYGWW